MNILLIIALILFALKSVGVDVPVVDLGWLGLAFLAAGFLWT